MGYKVKSIDKLEKQVSGATVSLVATVTFTDGVKDMQATVRGEGINPYNRTQAEVDEFIKLSLEKAIAAYVTALDKAVADAVKLEPVKTSILSSLAGSGLTVLLAMMLWLAPMLSWASDLYPSWTALTNATASAGVSVYNADTYLGQIDMSAYYSVAIWANIEETDNNPAGTAGVSVWATATASGTTNDYVGPIGVGEVSAAEYTKAAADPGVGVTKFLGTYSGIPYVVLSGAKGTAGDLVTIHIRYKLMKGQN